MRPAFSDDFPREVEMVAPVPPFCLWAAHAHKQRSPFRTIRSDGTGAVTYFRPTSVALGRVHDVLLVQLGDLRGLLGMNRAIAGSLRQICRRLRFSNHMLLMQMPKLQQLIRRGIEAAPRRWLAPDFLPRRRAPLPEASRKFAVGFDFPATCS
jgi:hypothetical protein